MREGWYSNLGIIEIDVDPALGRPAEAVYTIRYAARVFVLHVFQKKSKRGIAMPKADREAIELRLKVAAARAKEPRE